jgi:hypothetical protein
MGVKEENELFVESGVVLLWLMLAKPRFLRFLGDIVRNKIAENMKIFVKID